jgi:hypothetical protein
MISTELEAHKLEGGEKNSNIGPYMSGEQINNSIELCKTAKNPVKLTWENLNYEVEIKVNSKDANNTGKSSYKQ